MKEGKFLDISNKIQQINKRLLRYTKRTKGQNSEINTVLLLSITDLEKELNKHTESVRKSFEETKNENIKLAEKRLLSLKNDLYKTKSQILQYEIDEAIKISEIMYSSIEEYNIDRDKFKELKQDIAKYDYYKNEYNVKVKDVTKNKLDKIDFIRRFLDKIERLNSYKREYYESIEELEKISGEKLFEKYIKENYEIESKTYNDFFNDLNKISDMIIINSRSYSKLKEFIAESNFNYFGKSIVENLGETSSFDYYNKIVYGIKESKTIEEKTNFLNDNFNKKFGLFNKDSFLTIEEKELLRNIAIHGFTKENVELLKNSIKFEKILNIFIRSIGKRNFNEKDIEYVKENKNSIIENINENSKFYGITRDSMISDFNIFDYISVYDLEEIPKFEYHMKIEDFLYKYKEAINNNDYLIRKAVIKKQEDEIREIERLAELRRERERRERERSSSYNSYSSNNSTSFSSSSSSFSSGSYGGSSSF